MFPCQQTEMCQIVLDQFRCGGLVWKSPDITVSHMEQEWTLSLFQLTGLSYKNNTNADMKNADKKNSYMIHSPP